MWLADVINTFLWHHHGKLSARVLQKLFQNTGQVLKFARRPVITCTQINPIKVYMHCSLTATLVHFSVKFQHTCPRVTKSLHIAIHVALWLAIGFSVDVRQGVFIVTGDRWPTLVHTGSVECVVGTGRRRLGRTPFPETKHFTLQLLHQIICIHKTPCFRVVKIKVPRHF